MAEMTPQEALKVIDKVHDYPCPYGIGGTAWMYIRSCIEKQIPEKPILKEIKAFDGSTADFVLICPVCGRTICAEPFDDVLSSYLKEEYPHCHCGQALDWGDTK